MFLYLSILLLSALIQLLLLPNIQSCPYLTSLDSSPDGKLAASNLRGNHGSDYHDNRQLQGVSSASSSSPTSSPSYPTSTASNPFCVKTGGRPPKLSTKGIQTAVKSIKTLFYGNLSAYANNSLTLSDIFGQSIRLAFHDAGEVDLTNSNDFKGADGCISDTKANKGLKEATSFVNTLLEPLWQKYCDLISRGDFWALIGKLSVEKADPTGTMNIPYYYGRVDKADCALTDATNPLPNPFAALNTSSFLGPGLVHSFVNRMGLTVNDLVTLSGAHTIGHVHLSNNPELVDGAWDDTPHVFDNNYFNFLLNSQSIARTSTIVPVLNFWKANNSETIRLNTDIAIAFGFAFQPHQTSQECSSTSVPTNSYGCINPLSTTPPSTLSLVQLYAANNSAFLTDFASSFSKMSNIGYGFNGSTGKLGSLTMFTPAY